MTLTRVRPGCFPLPSRTALYECQNKQPGNSLWLKAPFRHGPALEAGVFTFSFSAVASTQGKYSIVQAVAEGSPGGLGVSCVISTKLLFLEVRLSTTSELMLKVSEPVASCR